MEAAFGLSVTLTMLMTTILLTKYLLINNYSKLFTYSLLAVFLIIELSFLCSNMKKFEHGGWLTLLIGFCLVGIMYIWYSGKKLKNRYKKQLHINEYLPSFKKLSNDISIQKYATHIVYLTIADKPGLIEKRIIESIFCEQAKRADLYWLLHVEVDDAPYTMSYSTEIILPEDLIYVKFKLGFRVVPRVNLYFKEIVNTMIANKEITIEKGYCLLNEHGNCGDFRFVLMKSFLSFENQLPFWKNIVMKLYFILDKISLPDTEAFGLDYNNVVVENVPLIVGKVNRPILTRENP